MDYNQFRIWIGRLFGVALLLFAQNPFNFYAIGVILLGAVIRFWATGYIHKDREVTMAGPYKLLRHPLYLGNFLEGLGLTLFVNVWQLTLLYIPLFFIIYHIISYNSNCSRLNIFSFYYISSYIWLI